LFFVVIHQHIGCFKPILKMLLIPDEWVSCCRWQHVRRTALDGLHL